MFLKYDYSHICAANCGRTETFMFYIGCHLSTAGGYEAMAKTALSIGANTFQYFTRNPRGSRNKQVDEADIAKMNAIIKENGFFAPLAHAPYTYNPCSKDENIRKYSTDSMREDLAVLELIPGVMYNFHPGSHVGQGADVGIAYTAEFLNSVVKEDQSTLILIETMAGKGSEIGRNFEEIRAIIDLVEPSKRAKVGVCLDTCHVNDGGYDIAGDTEKVIAEFDSVIGLDRLKAIHLNDSKNPLGAAKDRHEKIGGGTLGLGNIENIINNPKLKELPFYLETPNELDGYAKEIALLRSLRK